MIFCAHRFLLIPQQPVVDPVTLSLARTWWLSITGYVAVPRLPSLPQKGDRLDGLGLLSALHWR